ncbi:phage portal protein family protein [Dentiradicibacter hellwigii]
MILALMDAVGHGFAPVELEWRSDHGEWLPAMQSAPAGVVLP